MFHVQFAGRPGLRFSFWLAEQPVHHRTCLRILVSEQYSDCVCGCACSLPVAILGYLMASSSGERRTKYICMNSVMTTIGTSTVDPAGNLYPQEISNFQVYYPTTYAAGREATCAMCASTASTRGAVYMRIGQSTCTPSSRLLYAGMVGVSFYTDGGGGSEYLCMPPDPSWSVFTDGAQGGGRIWTTEYETGSSGTFRLRGLQNREAPCAMCEATQRRTSIMLPARRTCPSRFVADMNGYLASQQYGQQKTQYVCLDYNSLPVGTGSSNPPTNENGGLFYTTEVVTFPRDTGYVDGRELACVQCSSDDGPVYIRWGVRDCPSGSELLYPGWIGGSHYQHGGSATTLCMPDDAEYYSTVGDFTDGNQDPSYIYRTEYETDTSQIPSFLFLHDEEASCAVCQTKSPSVFTQWGSHSCPSGS
jgi:hypothetical protein